MELTTEQIAALGNVTFTISNPVIDTTAPIVRSLVLLSTEANASTSSAKIRYRIQISDDLSGFNSLSLNFSGPHYYSTISSYLGAWNLVAVEGTLQTYEGTIEIPQGSAEGDWTLQSLYVSDKAGNGVSVPLRSELQAKFTLGNSAENTPELEYQYAPLPVALNVSRTSVDVSAADQKVKVQLTINNDDLPTNYSINLYFNLLDENGYGSGDSISQVKAEFKLVSGTMANGVYEGELIVPRYAKNGNYTISLIAIDNTGCKNRIENS
jgi:hypothetical protein